MPINGQISKEFGVYRSVCCGAEIVIAEGVEFPDCPRHPKLSTKWKSVTDEPIRQAHELRTIKKKDGSSAA